MLRNSTGLTLPFALILTFIFSALVSVSYLFVSVNLRQMQSSLHELQAISIAEGINERIKARLNTKSNIQISPKQEEKLKIGEEDFEDEELAEEEEDFEDEFDEETEDFDEYYADEVLKISRYITFREPPEQPESSEEGESTDLPLVDINLRPEANVHMIGDIDIPRGTILNKGTKIVVLKDEKIDLKLKDIVPQEPLAFKDKLPIPKIKSLSPNYSEANKRGSFTVIGENLSYDQNARFTNKDISIENIKAGPTVEFLINNNIIPGLTRFYWENAHAEFYIIPAYDGSKGPIINEVTYDEKDFLDVRAGQRNITIMIRGLDLYLKKSQPVVISDVSGIVPKVKEFLPDEITVRLDIEKYVEPGSHSILIATEGGLSNSWIFNVLPPEEKQDLSLNVATVTSVLTLLDLRVVENLLPLIDEDEVIEPKEEKKEAEEESEDFDEIPEGEKLSAFANTDLETAWLLQTTTMIGNTTKTISEVIHRQIPNINAALITNGEVLFDGGNYKIVGATTAMTTLAEPTYISNIVLSVEGESEEVQEASQEEAKEGKAEEQEPPKSPAELGFTPSSLVTVYKQGGKIFDLDYSVISNTREDTIELTPPGLMDFHYEGDAVYQFIPPVISKEKISSEQAERYLVPAEFSLDIPNYAMAKNILRSNLIQFAELADLYTSDPSVPSDEFGFPIGYMSLSYIEGTPVYDGSNVLSGKGILVIDTRSDNQGRPVGEVEITGDSKNPVNWSGIIYVHGDLRIDGNVSINGALIVDNDLYGKVQISNNALGKIVWDPRAIKQTILYVPFTTKPGTIMISNKPIDLKDYIESGKEITTEQPPIAPTTEAPKLTPEEALVDTTKSPKETPLEAIPVKPKGKSTEEELIELF